MRRAERVELAIAYADADADAGAHADADADARVYVRARCACDAFEKRQKCDDALFELRVERRSDSHPIGKANAARRNEAKQS